MSDIGPAPGAEVIEPLGHLEVLRLQPGDVLVFTFPGRLSVVNVDRLRDKVQSEFPGHKAIVIDSGGQVGVIREATS